MAFTASDMIAKIKANKDRDHDEVLMEKARGSVMGSLVGGGIGAIISYSRGFNMILGAVIGGVIGGVATKYFISKKKEQDEG